ncbi:SRPBCC domain-containing protein [Candidatus Solincola tengchongensis]|uniref:SRPBCC domain-containing protein n=1 Tax=Candidatus Solincola tengchongensis TaxID=2900693 RepID=UPI0025802A0F|nr:SRPBCC domain-containing protein [Candidatus Solincola tengchongensis]
MPEKEMVTSVVIKASPRRVWEVLTDLSSYSEWNPMIRRAEGEIRKGARLKVHFRPEGRRKGRIFHPLLRVVDAERELRWGGRSLFPWVFDFEHYWVLEPRSEGATLLRHGAVVRGLLAPLVMPVMERMSRRPFQAMNRAHKERAESV